MPMCCLFVCVISLKLWLKDEAFTISMTSFVLVLQVFLCQNTLCFIVAVRLCVAEEFPKCVFRLNSSTLEIEIRWQIFSSFFSILCHGSLAVKHRTAMHCVFTLQIKQVLSALTWRTDVGACFPGLIFFMENWHWVHRVPQEFGGNGGWTQRMDWTFCMVGTDFVIYWAHWVSGYREFSSSYVSSPPLQ